VLLQFFEPGEKTVRVFSDGVPERDCPREDASSRFYATAKLIMECQETKAMQRLDV